MLFRHGVFSPEVITDQRARTVLQAVAESAAEPIRASDILIAAVRSEDAEVTGILAAALLPGCTLKQIVDSAPPCAPQIGIGGRLRSRKSFAPKLIAALEEFTSVLNGSEGVLTRAALPLLMHFVLTSMDERECRILGGLDIHCAAWLFQQRVLQVKATRSEAQAESSSNFEQQDEDKAPYILPPEIITSEDLTFHVRTVDASGVFPFDGEPQFELLFDSICRVLHRRRTSNVLLTGERGVGKNTIVAELARRAAIGQVRFLEARRFLSIDARHVAPDESRHRLAAILDRVMHNSALVVCVDGLAALLRSERGTNNKAVFLSAVAQAQCKFIGLVTPREHEEFVLDDPDFAEFFARVDVVEPGVEVALKLLAQFAHGLECSYQVAIEPEAVRQSVVLSANYILNDQLPAKALNLLRAACEEIDYERTELGKHQVSVTADDMIRGVSAASGVPEETLRGIAERTDYEQSLREVIFGQDHVVREVATELGLIKAGMTDPTKPASVMMFLGQTGTGKTEMAKALARFYSTSKRLKVYALGNCVEPHSVSTIIGVPPGYVGTDQGGRLVNELNADPYSVFLFDEADKAHPDVLQPLLNLFDEGWVSDQRGVRAYGNRSIFILTTNVGQRMIAQLHKEGKSLQEITARMKEALGQIRHPKADRPVFPAEFLSRIKRVIVFRPLDAGAIQAIARKGVEEMKQTWFAKRGKRLEVPDSLTQYIGQQAHLMNERSEGKEGGRIVRKLHSEWLESTIQREITLRSLEYRSANSLKLAFDPLQLAFTELQADAPLISVKFVRNETCG